MKDLSVITVTYNAADQITEQMSSVISGCNHISYEQIIVDNNSQDNTVSLVKEKFPQAKVIANETNQGFGRANNTGLKSASGRFILFLNPDMKVEPASLDKLVDYMEQHQEIGLASCKLVDENGKLNPEAKPRRLPRVRDMVVLLLKLPHLFPATLNHHLMADFDGDKEQEVESVRGAFMLVRREVIEKLGWGFDPRYFIWFEDIDTCREVKKLGYKIVYAPIISCVDYVGQSFNKMNTLWKQKQFTKSMLQYFQKWEPWYKWIWIAALRPVAISMVAVYSLIKK